MSSSTEGLRFELDGLHFLYDSHPALAGVDLVLEPGAQVALVGPSGCGKTTLLRILNGMLLPTRGRCRADGHDLRHLPAAHLRRLRSNIGFIHQDLGLVPNLLVLTNVLAGRIGRQGSLAVARRMFLPPMSEVEEVHAILERVGIPDTLYRRVDRLSGGQRQRVAIARCLYQGGRAVLADEPVSSVDPARARAVVELLTEVCRERGLTLCMSLHNVDLARRYFQRVVGLRHGEVHVDSSPADLAAETLDGLFGLHPHPSKVAV